MKSTPLFKGCDLYLKELLEKKLTESAIRRELIDVTGIRGIGKTSALIEFAEKFNLSVVVPKIDRVFSLKEKYKNANIYSEDGFFGEVSKKFIVVDEGVNVEALEYAGNTVVTGFISKL